MAEEEGTEESSLLQDRASRRGRKEEPKLSDVRICSSGRWPRSLPWGEKGRWFLTACFMTLSGRARARQTPAFQSSKGRSISSPR